LSDGGFRNRSLNGLVEIATIVSLNFRLDSSRLLGYDVCLLLTSCWTGGFAL
jgi:hypothetical protein